MKDGIGTKHAMARVGCKAIMYLKKEEKKWVVSRFTDNHNHEFCIPKSTRLLRGHRTITRVQKSLVNMLNEVGVPTRKIMSILEDQSRGQNKFTQKWRRSKDV
ncbi:hypothetical protein ACH5RR_019113 [Cinchona calisaya]|uniref:FAR1 domain-containing protein n=1 Tax=Cinchona calisaya TaxID=153742 RepID=A0ABD2ZNE1_9GENT